MRFIHVSDLHIGHRLCDRDRLEEHILYFDWLLELCRSEKADYLMITGDVFDTAAPSNTSLRLYYRFLSRLRDYGLAGACIIGGNHDSPSSLGAPRELLESFNVHVRGSKSANAADDVVLLDGGEGVKTAFGLVPYLRERDIRSPKAGETIEERDSGIKDGIRGHYAAVMNAARDSGADYCVLTGHLFASGFETGKGERDLYVGNLGHIGLDLLPAGCGYIGLGHIHTPRILAPGIAYAGSPIPMDFSEEGTKHVIAADVPGDVRLIPVPSFRRLLRFAGTAAEVLEAVSVTDDGIRGDYGLAPWAEVLLDAAVPDPSVYGEIEEAFLSKGIELLRIRLQMTESITPASTFIRNLEDISPLEMFELRCSRKGVEVTDQMKTAFGEILQKVSFLGEDGYED